MRASAPGPGPERPHLMRRLGRLLAAGALVAMPVAAKAQDHPAKSFKIIVPNPPGGSGDISARLVAQKLSDSLHVSVVIENQSGAGGSIAMNLLKRAAPDGATIGVAISTAEVVDRIQNKAASFDLNRDFTPLTAIANNPVVLLTTTQFPAANMAELVAYLRPRPGQVSYASPGIGTAHHLYGEMLNRYAGIQMVNVPYRGVSPALNDVLGGHVPIGIISLSAALPHIRTGRLRAIALFDIIRNGKIPEVPTAAEALPNFEPARSWIGFLGPPDLPAAITTRLHQEIVTALRSGDVPRLLDDNGLDVLVNSPAEFAAMIRRDTGLWAEAAVAAGLMAKP
jgi:tripartite-type tricarboxylate transporter receptor subunit TctC